MSHHEQVAHRACVRAHNWFTLCCARRKSSNVKRLAPSKTRSKIDVSMRPYAHLPISPFLLLLASLPSEPNVSPLAFDISWTHVDRHFFYYFPYVSSADLVLLCRYVARFFPLSLRGFFCGDEDGVGSALSTVLRICLDRACVFDFGSGVSGWLFGSGWDLSVRSDDSFEVVGERIGRRDC